MGKTTIQINTLTLERLRMLKNFERQSYDDVLNILIENQPEEKLGDEEISEIQKGLEDIKLGRTRSIEQVAKELGVKLN
jgi:hypothetical protein